MRWNCECKMLSFSGLSIHYRKIWEYSWLSYIYFITAFLWFPINSSPSSTYFKTDIITFMHALIIIEHQLKSFCLSVCTHKKSRPVKLIFMTFVLGIFSKICHWVLVLVKIAKQWQSFYVILSWISMLCSDRVGNSLVIDKVEIVINMLWLLCFAYISKLVYSLNFLFRRMQLII
jgi:hypothetical protein